MQAAFGVTLECENCGNEWEETYPDRTKVIRSDYRSAVVHQNEDCTVMGYGGCSCCGIETCPVCRLDNPVRVADREPIDREDQIGDVVDELAEGATVVDSGEKGTVVGMEEQDGMLLYSIAFDDNGDERQLPHSELCHGVIDGTVNVIPP